MNTITIDCGASFIKGAVFQEGKLDKVISRSAPPVGKTSKIFSSRHIVRLVEMVRDMILELAGSEKNVILCLSNEMHGFLLADEYDRPYTDYISWQYDLGKTIRENGKPVWMALKKDLFQDEIRRTGMPLGAGLPSSNLYCLLQLKEIREQCKTLRFYTLGTYILKKLSGEDEIEEHATNAAATGLYDLSAKKWNQKYIEKIGAGDIVMPSIGHKIIHFSLNDIEFHAFPAIGDQQAALLGAGFEGVGDLSFNLGTGAQVSQITDELDFSNNYQTRPYFNGCYLKTIPHIPSGRALNVYFRFVKSVLEQYGIVLNEDTVWEGIVAAAESGKENCLPQIGLDFFPNAINEEPSERGCIIGIEEHSFSFGILMRAVLEQMTDNFIAAADRLVPSHSTVERLVFSGGIARRLEMVRNRIADHYPGTVVSVSSNETMLGLYCYSEMEGNKAGYRQVPLKEA